MRDHERKNGDKEISRYAYSDESYVAVRESVRV